jgi:hypothetical protein
MPTDGKGKPAALNCDHAMTVDLNSFTIDMNGINAIPDADNVMPFPIIKPKPSVRLVTIKKSTPQ